VGLVRAPHPIGYVPLDFALGNAPAGLRSAEPRTLQLSGGKPAAHRVGVDAQARNDLLNRQHAFFPILTHSQSITLCRIVGDCWTRLENQCKIVEEMRRGACW
jgi:hypothetical protein